VRPLTLREIKTRNVFCSTVYGILFRHLFLCARRKEPFCDFVSSHCACCLALVQQGPQ
jgi:hypothetical protein